MRRSWRCCYPSLSASAGVDPKAATGRAERRQQTNHHHEHRGAGNDTWDVPATHLFERQIVADEKRRQNAADRASSDLAQRTLEDARQQSPRLGPQRRPNPDLPATLVDGEGHERVETGGRQQEHAHHHHREREARHIVAQLDPAVDLVQRKDLIHAQGRIQHRRDLPDPARYVGLGVPDAQHEAHRKCLSRRHGVIHRAGVRI